MENTYIENQEYSKSKPKILNISLITFAIGTTLTILVALFFSLIPQMQDIAKNIFKTRGSIIIVCIISIGLIVGINFAINKANLSTIILMYASFSLVQGFMLSIVFVTFVFEQESWKIFIVLLVPSITMAIMGTIGYLGIFDFSKLGRFLSCSLIILFVLGIILIFIPGMKLIWTLYSIMGYALFTLYAGFDLWRISNFEKDLDQNISNEEIIKYGIRFGLSLQIDFIQLIWFLYNIIR